MSKQETHDYFVINEHNINTRNKNILLKMPKMKLEPFCEPCIQKSTTHKESRSISRISIGDHCSHYI